MKQRRSNNDEANFQQLHALLMTPTTARTQYKQYHQGYRLFRRLTVRLLRDSISLHGVFQHELRYPSRDRFSCVQTGTTPCIRLRTWFMGSPPIHLSRSQRDFYLKLCTRLGRIEPKARVKSV